MSAYLNSLKVPTLF